MQQNHNRNDHGTIGISIGATIFIVAGVVYTASLIPGISVGNVHVMQAVSAIGGLIGGGQFLVCVFCPKIDERREIEMRNRNARRGQPELMQATEIEQIPIVEAQIMDVGDSSEVAVQARAIEEGKGGIIRVSAKPFRSQQQNREQITT